MEGLIVKETIGMKKFAVKEDVKLMEDGKNGHLGQAVEVIVRCQDLEGVIILLPQMEELTVWVNIWKINPALEEDVKLMEEWKNGHLGQAVEVSVRCQDILGILVKL